MNRIQFHKTSNILINAGIIGLFLYLQEYDKKSKIKYTFELKDNYLEVQTDKLLELLEDVYYFMAKELYDTSTKKQLEVYTNAFLNIENDSFKKFPKMTTFGLAALITNDKAGKTRGTENTKRKKELLEKDPDIVKKITDYFEQEGIKLQEQIYFNEPYTKVTRLKLDEKFFLSGDKICSLTGENFQKLESLQNVSPFIAGLVNFNSFFREDNKPLISWKIKYIVHFSPKICFYRYSNRVYDSLSVSFFSSNNLKNLLELYEINKSFYKTSIELRQDNYMANYHLFEEKDFFTEQYENLFAIIYTFYLQFLKAQNLEVTIKKDSDDPFAESQFENIPISLISFNAKKFSKTMRPDSYEEINNFKFLIRLIFYLESNGIKFSSVLHSLKIIPSTQRRSQDKYRIERQLRNKIFEKFINAKSILAEIEWLFFQSFKYLFDKKYYENRYYDVLVDFVKYYEQVINYGGNKSMNSNLQEKAINLGTSIGQGILLFENEKRNNTKMKENIKKARKYMIGIRKAGNFEKFADALERIQEKYFLSVSKEFLQQINNNNFSYLQKFVVISMFNQVNPKLRNQKESDNQEKIKE